MDIIFVFEFESSYHIDSIALREPTVHQAIAQLSIILGDSAITHCICIRKLF